jgi:hypothetical protein
MNDNAHEWGLAAVGRHGSISIDLDEPIGRDGSWRLQINGNGWEFIFDVAGPSVARAFSAFVTEHANRTIFAEHRVGSFQAAEVVIVKDSEFGDRFWLRIRGAGQGGSHPSG